MTEVGGEGDGEAAVAAVELAEVAGAADRGGGVIRPPEHLLADARVGLREGALLLQVPACAPLGDVQRLGERLAAHDELHLARAPYEPDTEGSGEVGGGGEPLVVDGPIVRDGDECLARRGRQEAHVIHLLSQHARAVECVAQRRHELVDGGGAHREVAHLARRARIVAVEHHVVHVLALSPERKGRTHAEVRSFALVHLSRRQAASLMCDICEQGLERSDLIS
mmetsp:Transcript_49295/g.105303  ORF Transcript_49295/g.105303 Transcript_49295/m.105303 type:complete len:224 (-) Transcript_49295:89-760(-)